MTTPKLTREQEAAEKYATGNHRVSFPDTAEMNAFRAGARWQREQENAMLKRAVEVIEWYAAWDWSDKYVQPVPKRARDFLQSLKEGGK